ncbi:DUF1289 domain-containing protein [Pandoraea cepalis]|uniref:Fe-S oxidoreductase n=1 Tax=Pandoraea cepalis TaxID=2508294 RepID=A0A5E4S2K1_9BURK|nr:DUF1289 domain-containing protein [Pandoraea cepalis]VVD68289.1 hypothetical protein PCE31107_00476 [Pandoraea cepalis]
MTLPESPVPSPCTNICRMNPATGWCSGCWRTLDEIAAWSTMAEGDKRHIWSLLPARRVEHEPPPVQYRRVIANDPGSGNA